MIEDPDWFEWQKATYWRLSEALEVAVEAGLHPIGHQFAHELLGQARDATSAAEVHLLAKRFDKRLANEAEWAAEKAAALRRPDLAGAA